jgi:predicted lactoylglutathione lyase
MHHDHDEHFYPVHLFDPDGHRIEAVFTDRT